MPQTLPIAILVPHSGLRIPQEVSGRFALSERDIFNEADIYIDQLFDFRDRVVHWLFFPYSRAFVDVNRPDDAALIRDGDGIIKHRTSYGHKVYQEGLAPDQRMAAYLKRRYWQPWHQSLATIAADPRIRLVIDAHSMAACGPTSYDDPSQVRPWGCVCNLGDLHGEVEEKRRRISLAPERTKAFAGELLSQLASVHPLGSSIAEVRVNQPYWGGWDVWSHAGHAQPWIMLELSRALYLGDQNADGPIIDADPDRLADLRQRIWEAIRFLYQQVVSPSP